MKLKRFRNKFISMLLTLAMLLTLFPTAVFAEDTAADRPASAEFKIMGLYALRDNGRRVSFFSYESRDNAFLTKANMTYPDGGLSSEVQRFVKKEFKRRFPAQAFAGATI